MEFRDNLLQNDIDHLGKKFRILSAELLLIQDFIKEEFGSKFESFCTSRREEHHASFSQTSTNSSTFRQQGACGNADHGLMAIRIEDNCEQLFVVKEEPCIIPDGLEQEASDIESISEHGYDPIGEEFETNDSNCEIESKHNPIPINTEEAESIVIASGSNPVKIGRPKSMIHRYFEKVKAGDGQLKDKCYTCGNFVSSKVPRLKKHILKCRGKDSKVMHIINKLEAAKYTQTSKNSKVMEILKNLDLEKCTPSNDNRLGRKSDIVRLAFKDAKDASGYKKSQCLSCGDLVSNKPSRMRNHLNRCTGVSKQDMGIEIRDLKQVLEGPNKGENPESEKNQTAATDISQLSPAEPSSSSLPTSPCSVLEIDHNFITHTEHLTTQSQYSNNSNSTWRPADEIGNFPPCQLPGSLVHPPDSSYR